jgi:hypothetical protein
MEIAELILACTLSLGLLIGLGVMIYLVLTVDKDVVVEARRKAFKEAAKMAKEKADFEMADTEGRSNQRFERARLLYELELDLRSASNKC